MPLLAGDGIGTAKALRLVTAATAARATATTGVQMPRLR
jgi:hypothetical protein